MSSFDMNDWDDFEDDDVEINIRNVSRENRKKSKNKKTASPAADKKSEISILVDDENSFSFSYKASRHEYQWIIDSLGDFYRQKWFDDLLRLVKGGKEASVYQCQANETTGRDYIAAKVYRPRKFRNLRKDHVYREGRDRLDESGRVVTDDGMAHAMRKRTAYGLQLLHTSWINHEFKTMQILFDVGADVPRPLACGNNAILMDYVGGSDFAAPTLNTVDLSPSEAQGLFERVLKNIELMLMNQRIHADLSAYNILYWEGEITFIDFPQAIDPQRNQNAFPIFKRDLVRVCDYFSLQGVAADPERIAADLWRKYIGRIDPLVHPLYLDAENEEDRKYWESI